LSEDLLGREGFAQSLAKTIYSWRGNDSLVIGLYGVWGSGKSSVKNMAVDAMQSLGEDIPEIVEFNPWQWAGQQGLLEAFFREIALALGKADKTRAGKKRAVKWRFYGAVLNTGSDVLAGLSSLFLYLLILVSALGISLSVVETPWLRNILTVVLAICLVIAALFKWGGKLSDRLSSVLTYHAELHRKSLEEIKTELQSDLEKLRKPVLVVIDDIDRLTKDETRLLIQLVKANADFPNIVYLLIFQRDIVEKNLESCKLSGKDYLEKIVQVPFDIPQAEQLKIQRVLFSCLDRILEQDKKILERFDQTRWGNIFIGGLSSYFKTLRNVYRYLSTLSFHVNLFKGHVAFEVNPIDLVALEVLRHFEPGVYSAISQNKNILANIYHRDDRDEEDRKVIDDIIEKSSEDHKKDVREIIKQLFPTIEWALGGPSYANGFSEKWFHDLRVCHPDVFSRYFQLTIPEKDISQSELEDIISKVSDRNSLKEKFDTLRDTGLLDIALNRLDSYKQKIPIESALSFIPAIFDMADDLPSQGLGIFDIGPHTHASRIVYWYLRQEPDPEKRGQILYDSISKSDGLSLAGRLIINDEHRREKEKDPNDFLVSDSQLQRLKQLFVDKVRKIAYESPNQIGENKELVGILYRWLQLGEPVDVRNWVDEFTKSRENLLVFLVRFTKETRSYSIGDYVYHRTYEINLKDIEDFIPIEVVKKRLANIDKDQAGDNEKCAIEAFEKAIRRKEEGKSDDHPWDDD